MRSGRMMPGTSTPRLRGFRMRGLMRSTASRCTATRSPQSRRESSGGRNDPRLNIRSTGYKRCLPVGRARSGSGCLERRDRDVLPAIAEVAVVLLDYGDEPRCDVRAVGAESCLEQFVLVLQGQVHSDASSRYLASSLSCSGSL